MRWSDRTSSRTVNAWCGDLLDATSAHLAYVILAHLERMHRQLEQTQATVASLQALLSEEAHPRGRVEIRRLPMTRVLAERAVVPFDCASWLEPALEGLHAAAGAAGLAVAGRTARCTPTSSSRKGPAR